MLAENWKFQPQDLPTTEKATFSHSLRVHIQVCIWSQLSLNCLNPCEWGWKMVNGILIQIKTDLDAATEDLLEVIICVAQAMLVCKEWTKMCISLW